MNPNPHFNEKYVVGDPAMWAAWREFAEPMMVQPTTTQNVLALLFVAIFVLTIGLFVRSKQ